MARWAVTGLFLVIFIGYTTAQVPPRLLIPGAIPLGGRPAPFRTQAGPSPRLRRPNTIPAREVRPVVEEIEEPNYPSQSPNPNSDFEDEVNKLTFSSQSAARDEEEEEYRYNAGSRERQSPLPFRPERPVPITREQVREKPIARPAPPRPVIRQDLRDEPVKQVVRQQLSRPAPQPSQPIRQKTAPRQQAFEDEDDYRDRKRKPVVEILRKYRDDNEDGSITWGFENSDGTFKEETLGVDCVITGKYGYVDPDGVKREFSYETGNKCDKTEEEEEELLPLKQNVPQSKNRPSTYNRPAPQQLQPQYLN